jgi:hypothetical protein
VRSEVDLVCEGSQPSFQIDLGSTSTFHDAPAPISSSPEVPHSVILDAEMQSSVDRPRRLTMRHGIIRLCGLVVQTQPAHGA